MRDLADAALVAVERAEVGDFGALALLLVDPEIPLSELEPHRVRLARLVHGVKLTTRMRNALIMADYRASRAGGLSKAARLARLAEKWNMDVRSVRSIVGRDENASL